MIFSVFIIVRIWTLSRSLVFFWRRGDLYLMWFFFSGKVTALIFIILLHWLSSNSLALFKQPVLLFSFWVQQHIEQRFSLNCSSGAPVPSWGQGIWCSFPLRHNWSNEQRPLNRGSPTTPPAPGAGIRLPRWSSSCNQTIKKAILALPVRGWCFLLVCSLSRLTSDGCCCGCKENRGAHGKGRRRGKYGTYPSCSDLHQISFTNIKVCRELW